MFLCMEKNEKTSWPELRVCLADHNRDWIERMHSFRKNLKYAEVLLLYPEGDLKILQSSDMVGQFKFSIADIRYRITLWQSSTLKDGESNNSEWDRDLELWQMLVAEKWWSLRAILKEAIKGYGRRFQIGNWQEVAIKDDLGEHFCIKLRRFTPIAKYIFTNFFMKAIIEFWMTCETGQKFKMPLCWCMIRWDKVNINASLLCLAPNRHMD